MVHLERKVIEGNAYLYLAIRAKVNGRSRRVWQKYLGPEKKFQEKAKTLKLQLDDNYVITTVDFGLDVALWQIAEKLQVQRIIDEVVGKRSQGLSVGQYLLISTLNRCVKPKSKSKLRRWLNKSYLKQLLPSFETYLDSMAYVNHFDYLSAENIDAIQQKLNRQLQTVFNVKMEQLFYDPSNFFTYNNPKNSETQSLARHGNSKEGRRVLNLVSLSLVCTSDGGLPLIHQVYPGNVQDASHFKSQHKLLLNHLKKLKLDPAEVTLIFDKGNISPEAFAGIDGTKLRFICSVRPSSHKDLHGLVEADFEIVELANGKFVGVREYQREFHGQIRRLIVCYNPNKQSWSSKTKLSKLTAKITAIDEWFADRLNKHKWRSVSNVEDKIVTLLGKNFLDYAVYKVEEDEEGKITYSVTINQELFDEEMAKVGKSYLMTNHANLSAKDVVWLYRQQFTVERAFSYLKQQPEAVRVRPIYHHKDSSIRGHIFSCVLGLLLIMLLQRQIHEHFPEFELGDMKEALTDIQMAKIEFTKVDYTFKLITNSKMAAQLFKKLKLGAYIKESLWR